MCSGRHPVAVRALSDESEGEDSEDDDDLEMEAPVDAEEVWPVCVCLPVSDICTTAPYRWTDHFGLGIGLFGVIRHGLHSSVCDHRDTAAP